MKAALDVADCSGSAVLQRLPGRRYPVAVRAERLTITDADGNRYLDLSGGAAVSVLGHSHPEVVAAVRDQVASMAYAHTAFFSNEPQELLATRLVERFGDPDARVYFSCGGSEANETALKLAWQYWATLGLADKKIVISREHSYHGNTFGTLSVSGNAGRRRASAAPLLEWPRIAPCYEYRERSSGESSRDYAMRAADTLDAAIREAGAERIAAFIAEPVVGSSLGVVPAPPGYFERIREICDAHDVLLIADEIMCGSGRTGTWFAHEQEGFRPDIVTLAKGIAGGYQPLAATIASGRVADALASAGFIHGHTYIGHATACAAGLAVQRVIDREGLLERTSTLGENLRDILHDAFASHALVGDVRCRGLFAGIELVSDRGTRAGFADRPKLADELREAAMHRGLICYPSSIVVDGRTVPHVMLAPAMIATPRDIEDGVARLASALDDVFG